MEVFRGIYYTIAPPETTLYYIFKNSLDILILETEDKAMVNR